MVKKKGWQGEPARHSLASRGIGHRRLEREVSRFFEPDPSRRRSQLTHKPGEEYTEFVCPACRKNEYELIFMEPYEIRWTEPPRPKPYLAMGFVCNCGKKGRFEELVEEERRG